MYNPMDHKVSDNTLKIVQEATAKAVQKHGHADTPLSDGIPRGDKLAILMEEVGEVAEVLCDYRMGIWTQEEAMAMLKKELSQVSAVAAMWLECEINIGG